MSVDNLFTFHNWPKRTLQETADGFTNTLTFDMSVLLIYICIFKFRTIHWLEKDRDNGMPNSFQCESASKIAFFISFCTVARSDKIIIFGHLNYNTEHLLRLNIISHLCVCIWKNYINPFMWYCDILKQLIFALSILKEWKNVLTLN